MTYDIRPERSGDAAEILHLVTAAFADAPHSGGTEAAIIDALRADDALTVSLVAAADGKIVGHAAISPVTIDGRAVGWFGLGPVAVLPDRQRRGIGGALVRTGLDRLRNQGARGCVVLGGPGYYRRFGFAADAQLRYPDAPAPYFMRLAFGPDIPAGRVAYHPGFAAR
ncbi:possible N-acetyltransferase [Aurantimonas manganoxydans SI85-9A1]|uniref:Possible N-acetyltransferase n=1 Tax=Aurantimonas manganoxydans (strain ATCC BAA-1229 / DSM 21871 / SI85-9A1) TaxID=287752 RepID=Q1YML0_AURMS|nr:N-acetyltransferase [Aurantimonas manganoxydans]EAS51371.1 possible N-acetyltransferase [Aurantimonas manganoxydans SI85-9A1]